MLGVGQNAYSAAVLGECGRLPLSIQYQKRYIKYWLELLKMSENSLLNTCYKMQVSFDKTYQKGWVTDLKQLLFSNGFGHVWISQGVGNEELFLKVMVLQMTDIARQTWSNEISASSELSTCKEFKTLLNQEKYLQVINNYFIHKQLTRFRISNHQLLIEEGRHRGIDLVDRRCKFCGMNCVENEIHFLLVCPLYHNLRLKYILIPEHLGFYQSYSNFIKIMSSENEKVIRNLALFFY